MKGAFALEECSEYEETFHNLPYPSNKNSIPLPLPQLYFWDSPYINPYPI